MQASPRRHAVVAAARKAEHVIHPARRRRRSGGRCHHRGGPGGRRGSVRGSGDRRCAGASRRFGRRVHPDLAEADPQRRERRAAHRDRPDRDRHLLPGQELAVPVGRQPGQPAHPGRPVRPAGHGRGVGPAAGRDRPVGRVQRGRRRGGRPLGGLQPALAGGHRHRAGRHRFLRPALGRADHQPGPAVLRGHPGRPARPGGAAAADGAAHRAWRRRLDHQPQQHLLRPDRGEPEPGGRLDPHDRGGRGGRRCS